MIRAYVPAGVPDVKGWYAEGFIPAGTSVHVVSDAVRADHPDADDEELEFIATTSAMAEAAALAADDRPAVVAIDIDEPAEQLAEPVAVQRWAAVFVDDLLWYATEEVPFL